ncbi:MAG: matrixin family metalloprotease [Lacipirellulaceae bacterium]
MLTLRLLAVAALLGAGALGARAVTIRLDYSYDSSGFFSTATTNGAAARATLEAAASSLSTILRDTLNAVQTPAPFASSTFNGLVTWQWGAQFDNPSTGALESLLNPTIAVDEYRVYVGARDLGSTLGFGGPGGWSRGSSPSGGFTNAEINQINQTTTQFFANVEHRGEATTDFARWGGALTFDSNTNWNYNHTTPITPGANDLWSVALHELGHAIGLGASDEWNALVSGAVFTGPAATAVFNASPPISPDGGHWSAGTQSTVYGVGTAQEGALTPFITVGTRKGFTALDVAALDDIGWEVGNAPGLPGDYTGDGRVNAADYTRWRDLLGSTTSVAADGSQNGQVDQIDYTVWRNFYGQSDRRSTSVPEPAAALLASMACFVVRRR